MESSSPSLLPLLRRLTIRTKAAGLHPLEPNWAQAEVVHEVERQRATGRPVRIIILKARQLGISTVSEALIFWHLFLFRHTFGLVVSHENDAASHLFGMSRLFWETFPYRKLFDAKYHSRKELELEEPVGSALRIATAANIGAGRGRTINFLHASEVAFWDFAEDTMLGLRQTVPQTPESMIILESTARGIGNYFHETWTAAEAGDSEYVPLFFPWWMHYEYKGSFIGLEPTIKPPIDPEEKALRRLGVSDDALAWRRYALANLAGHDLDGFRQEYPSTPEEAFITTGSNVFPQESLRAIYKPLPGIRGHIVRDGSRMRFQPDALGPFRMYRQPSKDLSWGQYFVAGDPAHAAGYDNACIQVINRRTYEQVGTWHGKIDPISFGDEIVKLGQFYNEAEIVSEVEGPGYATISRIISLEYPNVWRHRVADRVPGQPSQSFGWSTNWKRKDWAISELVKLVGDRTLEIHDRGTFDEMRTFVMLGGDSYGPADKAGHDDRVMALAIACVCSRTDGPLDAYESDEFRNQVEPIPTWETWKGQEA